MWDFGKIIRTGLFIVIAVIFLHRLCFAEKPPNRTWQYKGYDLLESYIYPYPSKPLGSNWKIELSKKLIKSASNQFILAGDVNGDGRIEICLSNTSDILIFNSELKIIGTIKTEFNGPILRLLADIDGDNRLDIGINSAADREKKIVFYNWQGKRLLSIWEKNINLDSSIEPLCVLKGGDILATIFTGYGRLPRGIARYDAKSRKKLWYYGVGAGIISCSIADIDNDNQLDMLFGCASPENGAVGYGGPYGGSTTYDDCDYTMVIDENGRERYTIKESSKLNNLDYRRFVKFSDQSPYKILGWNQTGGYRRPISVPKIIIRDAKTGKLENTFYGKANYRFRAIACDIDGDGVKEIIATNYEYSSNGSHLSNPINYILDSNLNLIKMTTKVPGAIRTANDLDGDGRAEFIFQNNGLILITDSDFNILWSRDISNGYYRTLIWDQLIVVDADGDGVNEIYFANNYEVGAAIYQLKPVPVK